MVPLKPIAPIASIAPLVVYETHKEASEASIRDKRDSKALKKKDKSITDNVPTLSGSLKLQNSFGLEDDKSVSSTCKRSVIFENSVDKEQFFSDLIGTERKRKIKQRPLRTDEEV